jgi:hypothetical protein
MKTLIIVLLFACLSTIFTSCVKTDISPNNTNVNQTPTNNTPKDGANPVSNPVTPVAMDTAKITGNWVLVNDSTFSTGSGASDHSTIGNYIGQGGDYFNFTADGKLYIKEGGAIDTATYTITAGKNIEVNYSYYAGMPVATPGSMIADFIPLSLGEHAVTLNSTVITANGSSSRVIHLKR